MNKLSISLNQIKIRYSNAHKKLLLDSILKLNSNIEIIEFEPETIELLKYLNSNEIKLY